MKWTLVRRIEQGQLIPRFYGIAWHDEFRIAAVLLPVPLNLFVRMTRAIWRFCKYGWRAIPIDPREAYELGVRDGMRKSRTPRVSS